MQVMCSEARVLQRDDDETAPMFEFDRRAGGEDRRRRTAAAMPAAVRQRVVRAASLVLPAGGRSAGFAWPSEVTLEILLWFVADASYKFSLSNLARLAAASRTCRALQSAVVVLLDHLGFGATGRFRAGLHGYVSMEARRPADCGRAWDSIFYLSYVTSLTRGVRLAGQCLSAARAPAGLRRPPCDGPTDFLKVGRLEGGLSPHAMLVVRVDQYDVCVHLHPGDLRRAVGALLARPPAFWGATVAPVLAEAAELLPAGPGGTFLPHVPMCWQERYVQLTPETAAESAVCDCTLPGGPPPGGLPSWPRAPPESRVRVLHAVVGERVGAGAADATASVVVHVAPARALVRDPESENPLRPRAVDLRAIGVFVDFTHDCEAATRAGGPFVLALSPESVRVLQ